MNNVDGADADSKFEDYTRYKVTTIGLCSVLSKFYYCLSLNG